MEKKSLSAMAVVFLASLLHGQVGINTSSPRATLDVVARNSDGSSPEGILAPRLTGNALFASSVSSQYGSQQDGAIVYVTSPVTSANNTGQTVNVNAEGYYYFDATINQWKKMGDGSNIYTTNGILSNARTMDMNNRTMGFVNGRMSVGINAADPSAQLHVQSTTQGLLPPRMTQKQVGAIAFPASGLVVYCTDFLGDGKGCLLVNDSTNPAVPKWGSMCSTNSISPIILNLDCPARTVSGNFYEGVAVVGATVKVPYTGGNGGVYSAVSFASTGVSGLTAYLQPGILSSGNGSLTFDISGTPSAMGSADFAITVGGKYCSASVPIGTLNATVSNINCGSATFIPSNIQTGSFYSGIMSIPYNGGNGNAYPVGLAQVINGLSFTRQAGNLTNGSGIFTYTVSGIPTNAVTMNIPVAFNGATQCNVSKAVTRGIITSIAGVTWMRHNLGVDVNLDPDQNPSVQGLHGNYYQWGRVDPIANADTLPEPIPGWNFIDAPNGSWLDMSKTTNDPCPVGYRVPTSAHFTALINNTNPSFVGIFGYNATNFTAAKVFTAGNGNKITFPTTGKRNDWNNGSLSLRGVEGNYWTSSQGTGSGAFNFRFNNAISSMVYSVTRDAYSIRCVSE